MMSTSADVLSETLSDAFRAALLLTGCPDSAENAVLDGIAALESNDDVEKTLVTKTIQLLFRPRVVSSNHLQTPEFQRLLILKPVPHHSFILRNVLGISPAACANILNLTLEDFEESLCTCVQQLAAFPAIAPLHKQTLRTNDDQLLVDRFDIAEENGK